MHIVLSHKGENLGAKKAGPGASNSHCDDFPKQCGERRKDKKELERKDQGGQGKGEQEERSRNY